jgi:hypothetical protein
MRPFTDHQPAETRHGCLPDHREGCTRPAAGRRLRRAGLAALVLIAATAHGEDWILVASDDFTRTYLDASAVSRTQGTETRFQMRIRYSKPRDMMGLRYDGATTRYVISCESNLVLSSQRLLLDGAEMVWTFPVTDTPVQADREIPGEVLGSVCR